MTAIQYRQTTSSDIPEMAQIRAAEWQNEEYLTWLIADYLNRELHPQHALLPRISYVALEGEEVIGFIAGHLTTRFECDGELQWINVIENYHGKGIGPALLLMLATWFALQNSHRVCVNVDPDNVIARKFYNNHGAETLNQHWLVWNDIRLLSDSIF